MKISFHTAMFCLLAILYSVIGTEAAESFPFRAINPGDMMPATTLAQSDSGKKISLGKQGGGRITAFAFWGADLPSKKQRSTQALTQLQQLAPFFRDKQVDLLSVNAQGDSPEVIKEVLAASGFTSPTYLDPDKDAYGALGILVMPAVLLVDKAGKVVNGMGYSQEMVSRLKGEIEILLGEKTREQFEAELHPAMIEKSKEEKDANRHLNMGLVLAKRGQLEAAAREYGLAIKNGPKLAAAHIELGCISLELGKLAEAQTAIDNGLDLDPKSVRGEICNAQIRAEKGEVAQAIADLQAMIFRNGRNHQLHYVLGTFHAKKAEHEKAAQEFRKAYELLDRQIHAEE
ncbi:MAG: redoxin family protein [Desulfobulbaceae bacterium]|nr:redoxin family protein [Desulfobulbaceae bacterium]